MSKKIQSAMDIARRMAGGRVGYADGGAPGPDLRRQRQNAAMAGRELTPEQQAAVLDYIANMDARREQIGQQWDKSTEGMFMPSPALPQMDPKTQREIANRSLAGRDLNYQQMQALADNAGAKETRSENLGSVGAIGAEITGVPAMLRGASNVARGIEERDPIRGAGGVLEGTLGALPMASIGRGAISGLAEAAMSTPMRRAGLFGAASGLTSYSDEANAATKNVASHIAEDSEVKALQAEKQKAMDAFAKVNQQHARSGPETQRQALKPYQAELDRLNDKLEKAEDRARQQFMDQASFRDKNPGVPAAMFGAGLGLAGGIPLLKGLMERGADRVTRRPAIESAMRTAKSALEGPASAAEAAAAQTILRNKLGAWDAAHSGLGTAGKYGAAMGTGAMLGAEASQLPEQIDYISNEPGHPAREAAVKQFQNPDYWKERIGPALIGGGVGLLGAKVPNIAPRNLEFLTEAREVASRGQAPSAMQQLMARFRGVPAGPTEAAIADVRRYRDAAGLVRPAPEPPAPTYNANRSDHTGVPTQPGPSAAVEPIVPPGSSFAPHPAMGPAHAIEDAMPRFGQTPAPGLSPSSAAPASSPASAAPEKVYIPVPVRVFESGRIKYAPGVPEELGVTAGKFAKAEHRPQSKKAVAQSKKAEKSKVSEPTDINDIPLKPDKLPDDPSLLTRGMNRGGVVASALRIARAMGGRVHTGPILQRADGGRTDTVPMDVPSGSYVVPADIISALGEGDTSAGMKAVDGMFGPHAQSGGKDAVPIVAAGGEYVLSPSQVARIAGGDLSKAHAMLDQWVKATRAKHIETLANLPGPER